MATTHLAAKFKGNGQTVPACKQFAMTPDFGATSDDVSKVTCRRCLKAQGVAAAPAVEVVHARFGGMVAEGKSSSAKCVQAAHGRTLVYGNEAFTVTSDPSKVTCKRCLR